MIKLSEYVNAQGEITLYKYRVANVTNRNKLQIHLTEPDLVILEPSGEIVGQVVQSEQNLVDKSTENVSLLSYVDSFVFDTNDNVFEPLFNDADESFYLFSLFSSEEIDFDEAQLYYVDNDSKVEYDWNDPEEYLFQVYFSNIRSLKNFDNETIVYKLAEEINKQNTKRIFLKFPGEILINNIIFGGKKNNKKHFSKWEIKNETNFFPHFMTPIQVQSEYIQWIDNTHKILNNVMLLFNSTFFDWSQLFQILMNEYKHISDVKKIVFEFGRLINDCIYVTRTLTSNFVGFSESEKNKFKEEVYAGSSPKEYCDYKIFNFLQDTLKLNDINLVKTFESLILMCSSQIASSYCFKNGLTEEHKIYLPFYFLIDEVTKKFEGNIDFSIYSNYFNFDKDNSKWILRKNPLIENNIFNFASKTITLPTLPSKIEENNISNTPVDFNTDKSLNFNYLCFNPTNKTSVKDYVNKKIIEHIDFKNVTKQISWIETLNSPEKYWLDEHPEILKYNKNPNFKTGPRNTEKPIFVEDLEINKNAEVQDLKFKAFYYGQTLLKDPDLNIVESSLNNINYIFKVGDYKVLSERVHSGGSHSSPYDRWYIEVNKQTVYINADFIQDNKNIYYSRPNFVYSNATDFAKTLNSEEKVIVEFELEDDFMLEYINLKAIFGEEIEYSFNNASWKRINLSSKNSNLKTETKILF